VDDESLDGLEPQLVAILIFLFTYMLIITGRRSRTVSGLVGTFLMIAAGIFPSAESVLKYVHIDTLVVLFGIMILVGVLREGQFFSYVSMNLIGRVGLSPTKIFLILFLLTAGLSAFLDSVTVVLFTATATIQICKVMEVDPKPFIVAEILAANVAGTATSIGNPPNIILGLTFNLSIVDFLLSMGPPTIISLLILYYFVRRHYRTEFETMSKTIKKGATEFPKEEIADRRMFLLGTSMFITFIVMMILSQPLGISPALICLGMAAALLFLGGDKLTPILERVEWSTLLFFGSLFVVVGGLIETGVLAALAAAISSFVGGNLLLAILTITWVSAFGSSVIDNIPLAVTMLPLIQGIAAGTGLSVLPFVWSLSLGTCMGGNATIIGSSAGIVASAEAEKEGHAISYLEFIKVGVPAVLLTVGASTLFLLLRYAFVAA
jgi:Na+/H+ antiporter NhaD/arsenite permease-like protein